MRYAMLFVLLLAGCGSKPDGVKSHYVSDGNCSGEVKLIVLQDGTKCAVLIGYYKAALHCNWKQQ